MKARFHKFLGASSVAMTLATALMITACGDDSSSSNNVEREEDSSSSLEASSSSVDEESSSSEKSDLPKGLRAATLDDFDKNISLGNMFGSEVFLATGTKKGLFSLWVPDTAWIAFHSEMKDGKISFDKSNAALMGATNFAVYDSLAKMLEKEQKFQFVVSDDDKLQFSLNGGDYKDTEVAKVAVSQSVVTDAGKLKGVKLECDAGDGLTNSYMFYDGKYLVKNSDKNKQISWSAGYYDIQRGTLMMMPTFFDQPAYSLSSMYVDADFNMTTVAGKESKCKKSNFDFDEIKKEDLIGEWVASEDGKDWTFELKKDGSQQLQAKEKGSTVELKSGSWNVFGDLLVLKNSSCLNPSTCSKAVMGVVSGLDPKKGFNYDHSDSDTPAVPKTWTVPLYE